MFIYSRLFVSQCTTGSVGKFVWNNSDTQDKTNQANKEGVQATPYIFEPRNRVQCSFCASILDSGIQVELEQPMPSNDLKQ